MVGLLKGGGALAVIVRSDASCYYEEEFKPIVLFFFCIKPQLAGEPAHDRKKWARAEGPPKHEGVSSWLASWPKWHGGTEKHFG